MPTLAEDQRVLDKLSVSVRETARGWCLRFENDQAATRAATRSGQGRTTVDMLRWEPQKPAKLGFLWTVWDGLIQLLSGRLAIHVM